jgi:tRNA A37 threonylcarbamoyladenosine biosynthesis protein TsaE/endogenous inhibitor of DNA gyrase (YacG/DUF329 family)
MLTFTRESSSESQTLALAGEVARCLRPRDVIALDGALGAGKTSFVRGLVDGLGGDPRQVSSPTFVLCQEYEVGRHEGTEALRHEVGELPSPSGRGGGGEGAQESRPRDRTETPSPCPLPEGEGSVITRLAHIDAYRMGRGGGAKGQRGEGSATASDLESIGWDELLEQDDLIIAIEWPTRIPRDALPRLRTIRVQFEVGRGEEAKGPRDEGGGTLSPQSSVLGPDSFRRLSFAIPTTIEERFAPLVRQTRACRTCGREITADNPFFPFCSERCKLADLGAWFSEAHKITRPLEQRDVEEG